MQDNGLYNQQVANLDQGSGQKLKMSKKPVIITLIATFLVVVGSGILIAIMTHPKVSSKDSDNAPVGVIASSEDIDVLDAAVGNSLGVSVSMENGFFETTCAALKNIDDCEEKFGQGTIYGFVSDHMFTDDGAYAYVRLGLNKEIVLDEHNYEGISAYGIEFEQNNDGYIYSEIRVAEE